MSRRVLRHLALLLGVLGLAAHAEEPLAWAVGLGMGGGAHFEGGALFELAPRAQMLVGDGLRLGPQLELRTANFQTFEPGLGLSGVLPLADAETALQASVGGAYAWRVGGRDGAVLTASLTFGLYRVVDHAALASGLYLAYRHNLTGPAGDELTVGVSLGGGVIQLFMRMMGGG